MTHRNASPSIEGRRRLVARCQRRPIRTLESNHTSRNDGSRGRHVQHLVHNLRATPSASGSMRAVLRLCGGEGRVEPFGPGRVVSTSTVDEAVWSRYVVRLSPL